MFMVKKTTTLLGEDMYQALKEKAGAKKMFQTDQPNHNLAFRQREKHVGNHGES